MSKRYAPRLEELSRTYRERGVRFIGISSSHQDSVTDVVRFARAYDITFPILKDEASRVADQFGAERTPEVFLIDKDRRVRYRGRIDDQFEYEFERAAPSRLDLVVAIEEVLVGGNVRTPLTSVVGCRIGRVLPTNPKSTVTWHPEIAKIFQVHCTQCHRPNGSAPFPLTRYDDVEGWGETIRESLLEKRMPPWYAKPHSPSFANTNTLSQADLKRVLQWIDDGCPQGDASKDDFAPIRTAKWQLPTEPNLEFPISDADIEIPAQGRQNLQYFLVDTKLEKSVLLRALELRPSNRSVVRQASVCVIPPGLAKLYPSIRELAAAPETFSDLICWYSPDCEPRIYPEDIAREIPAGSKLFFRVLYRPTGRIEKDRTTLGLILADPEKVTRRPRTLAISLSNIALSNAHPTYNAIKQLSIDNNLFLLSVVPNLTIRGKSARVTLLPPTGAESVRDE
jgi:mono/diheme cytochrome c family protein